MTRLPTPGADAGQWGEILNDYLSQVHNTDGTLKNAVVTSEKLAPSAVSATNLIAATGSNGQVLTLDSTLPSGFKWSTPVGSSSQVNSDWNATSGIAQILNKPTLSAIATTGKYSDLTGTPTLATIAMTGLYSDITGAPTLATVAMTGKYSDLTGSPALSTVAVTGQYSDLVGTPVLATVATTGSYTDLTNLPTNTVTSVAGKTGVVTLAEADITGLSADLTTLTNQIIQKTVITVGTQPGADYVVDGTADDVEIQLAINAVAAAGGGTVFIRAGTYNITATIQVTTSNIKIMGEGMGLTQLVSTATTTGNTPIIEFYNKNIDDGSGSGYSLAADVTTGATSITVNSAGSIAVGDWLLLWSNKGATPESAGQNIGELHYVRSLSGNVLTLNDVVNDTYLTADSAAVSRLNNMMHNVTLTDLSLSSAATGMALSVGFCHAAFVDNLTISRVEVHNAFHSGMQIRSCINSTVENCSIYKIDKPSTGSTTLRYGIWIASATQNFTVRGCRFYQTRHSVTTGSSSGTHNNGVQRNIAIVGNTSMQSDTAHFDTHYAIDGVTFSGNTCIGGYEYSGASAAVCGFQMRGRNVTISDNVIKNIPGRGIQIFNGVGMAVSPVANTPSAGGSVDDGAHYWFVTNVVNTFECTLSGASAVQTTGGGSNTVNLTFALGPSGTTARNIYRTTANAPASAVPKLVATINDNTTTSFNDTVADSALGSAYNVDAVSSTGSIAITGNTISGILFSASMGDGVGVYIDSGGTSRQLISGNYFKDCQGVAIKGNAGGTTTGSPHNMSIIGNFFDNCPSSGSSSQHETIRIDSAYRVSIIGNQMINNQSHASSKPIAMSAKSDNWIISDNYFYNNRSNTITIIGVNNSITNNFGFNPIANYALGNQASTVTFDRVNGDCQNVTLTGGPVVATVTSGKNIGDELSITIAQDAVGGRTMTWPATVKFGMGGSLTLSTAALAVDVVTLIWDGTNWREKSRSTSANPGASWGSIGGTLSSQTDLSTALSQKAMQKATALTDAATIATDASTGSVFTVTIAGNRTLGVPSNPVAGQKCVWAITQGASGNNALSLAGGAGGFKISSDINGGSITLSTATGVTDYIGAIYNATNSSWDVVAFMKGL